jgi:hypothetical protein
MFSKMPSITDIIDEKGRINYKQLKDFVSQMSIGEFTDQAKYPFLVGKELYDGELMSRPSSASPTSTMRFSAAEFKRQVYRPEPTPPQGGGQGRLADTHPLNALPPGIPSAASQERGVSLSQAIFLVRRKLYSSQPDNIITIGRAVSNDIIIADYVISKNHAQIVLFKGMYFIVDLGSTNGTKVNHQTISPGSKVQLQYNDSVAFGRLVFVFANPVNIYTGLRKEILGL